MIRWGLIGGSDIAATRMIPAVRAIGQTPVAVSSSSARRAELFADRHDIASSCRDVDDLLARDDVEAVYISSVNRLHAEHTIAAAAAGSTSCARSRSLSTWPTPPTRSPPASGPVSSLRSTTTSPPTPPTPLSGRLSLPAPSARSSRSVRSSPISWPPGALTDPLVGGPILDLVAYVASVVNKIAGTPESATAIKVRQGNWDVEVPDCAELPEDTCMAVVRCSGDVLGQIHVGWPPTTPATAWRSTAPPAR